MSDDELTKRAAEILGLHRGSGSHRGLWFNKKGEARASFYPVVRIADAWLLVEKMEKNGFEWCIDSSHQGSQVRVFFFHRSKRIDIERWGKTAPRAITEAAVETCKGEKE